MLRRLALLFSLTGCARGAVLPQGALDPLPAADWTQEVRAASAAPGGERHTIHSYFNASPESPDGRWILFYSSVTRDGHIGEIRIRERATGQEKVLARDVTVEDAHRAACQQWVSGGRSVVFHDVRAGEWMVVSVDIETLEERILAPGRQVGWGQPHADIVPIYGPHFRPGAHWDLEILNVVSGEIRTVLAADAVRETYPELVESRFGNRRVSIFFPILSPDLSRVLLKMSAPRDGNYRSPEASWRHLLIGYDLKESRFLFGSHVWGHPSWHPDSRTVINIPSILIDTDTGAERPIPGLPRFSGSHPSISPDGRVWVTETRMEPFGGDEAEWGIVLGSMEGHQYRIVHRFRNDQGAESWRVSHPHPAFSPDGRRIYYNVSEGPWTQLYVLEARPNPQ